MQIEEQHSSALSLQALLKDYSNRVKLIRILHQALTSMGFTESAEHLQQETQVYAEDEAEFKMKGFFTAKRYTQAIEFVETLKLPFEVRPEVNRQLTELRILQLIDEKEYEEAIEAVARTWPNDELQQVKYLTMIATDQPVERQEIENRENSILEKCTTDSCQLKGNIEKMLKSYLSSGQQKSSLPEETFTRTVASSERLVGLGKPTFIRLNSRGDLACMICEMPKETQISVWSFSSDSIIMEHHWKLENFGNVQMVSWNEAGERVAVCSHSRIASYEATKMSEPVVVPSSNFIGSGKLLCCKWHPEGVLYFGGLFDCIFGVSVEGEIVRTIQPFPRTRDIIFESADQIFALGATGSLVVRYSLKEERVLQSFEAKSSFMDMHYEGGSEILVVTNRAYIYLLNSVSLQLIRTLVSPTNDKMFKIEVFLANNWLILFNQKLTALLQNTDVTNHHVWPDCDALDVRAGKMITVKSNITLWQTQGGEKARGEVHQRGERGEVHQRGEREHMAERIHISHRHSLWDESEPSIQGEWENHELIDEEMVHEMSSNSESEEEDEQEEEDEFEGMLEEQNDVDIQYLQDSDDSNQQQL